MAEVGVLKDGEGELEGGVFEALERGGTKQEI